MVVFLRESACTSITLFFVLHATGTCDGMDIRGARLPLFCSGLSCFFECGFVHFRDTFFVLRAYTRSPRANIALDRKTVLSVVFVYGM